MQHLDSYMCLLAKKIEKGLIIGKDVHSYCITDSNIYVSITCDNLFGLFAMDIYFFLNYLHKQTMLEMNWRNMEGKYERVVLEEGFDALTLIPPSGIEKYVSGDLPVWGRPWWTVKHVSI